MLRNPAFRPEMCGFEPPGGVYNHVSGIDVVRVGPDDFRVLEDNCRTPSGVSYMLENREAMLRLMPELVSSHRIAPISHYPEELFETLRSVAPDELPRRADGRAADARRLQQRLLRALVPGRRDGGRARRRRRSDRRRRDRLHAHHGGAEAGRRPLPPHRRRLPRSADLPAGFAARRARALRGLPRGQRGARECARHGHRRRQGHLPVRAGDDPLLSRRGARCSRTSRPGAAPSRTRSPTCSSICPSWS